MWHSCHKYQRKYRKLNSAFMKKKKNPAEINSTQGKVIKSLKTHIIGGMSKLLRIVNIIWELP